MMAYENELKQLKKEKRQLVTQLFNQTHKDFLDKKRQDFLDRQEDIRENYISRKASLVSAHRYRLGWSNPLFSILSEINIDHDKGHVTFSNELLGIDNFTFNKDWGPKKIINQLTIFETQFNKLQPTNEQLVELIVSKYHDNPDHLKEIKDFKVEGHNHKFDFLATFTYKNLNVRMDLECFYFKATPIAMSNGLYNFLKVTEKYDSYNDKSVAVMFEKLDKLNDALEKLEVIFND